MAEMLASNLVRLLVTVGILAAVYLFAIKPILDTTNDAIDSAFAPLDGLQEEIQSSFDDVGITGFDASDIDTSGDKANKRAEKLLTCIKRTRPNTTKMQACVEKFQE